MPPGYYIIRLSNVSREQDAHHLALARASIERGRKVLRDNPTPDTFAGGATRKPPTATDDGDAERVAVKERAKANRKVELQHLSAADAHIAKAERVVSQQRAYVERLRGDGYDAKLSEETLNAFEANLQLLREHREVIIRTIEGIDQSL
jgi:hypothetical protein